MIGESALHAPAQPALTSLSPGAGCGCKLSASVLDDVLPALRLGSEPSLLVGPGTRDDAGVVLVGDDLALVQTVDFFTPIVDDPFDFGRIAATNALSDIYAMGGNPIAAMNILAFPVSQRGTDEVAEILAGSAAVLKDANVVIAGGHSIEDSTPKFGLAVTGVVKPHEVVTNAGARPGDALVLTKPLGTGVIATAAIRDSVSAEMLALAVSTMATSNAAGAAASLRNSVTAMTDVTGFGLLTHLHELATASGVAIRLQASAVPTLASARDPLRRGVGISAGTRRNAEYSRGFATIAPSVDDVTRWLLVDATTSGGLLATFPDTRSATNVAAVVGEVIDGRPGHLEIL